MAMVVSVMLPVRMSCAHETNVTGCAVPVNLDQMGLRRVASSPMKALRRAALILYVYTILVILWGAWVRISHSGDGCGESWPLCKGVVVPEASEYKTLVEFFHRAMSGFYGIFVFAIWIWVLRVFKNPHPARRAANAVFFFTITEALLGAKLVLFGLVTQNSSWARTLYMSLHQINSLMLTGSVTLLCLALYRGHVSFRPRTSAVVALFVAVAVTGAWAALASTLFPTESLWEGLMKDFSPESHHLLRLRIMHPLSALLGMGGLAFFLWLKSLEDGPERKLHLQTALFLVFGILFGASTLLLFSPLWMKLTHLALAHLIWSALVRWSLPA